MLKMSAKSIETNMKFRIISQDFMLPFAVEFNDLSITNQIPIATGTTIVITKKPFVPRNSSSKVVKFRICEGNKLSEKEYNAFWTIFKSNTEYLGGVSC